MTRKSRRELEAAIEEIESHASTDGTAAVIFRRKIVDSDGNLIDVRRKEIDLGGGDT